ncbi:MAG TPA: hypothetical protein VIF33_00070 [Casimicrobiaceae bacterium]
MSGRGNLFPTEDTWLLASERQANRHVLAGPVHAAKGPLNNFSLTLTLLADGVAHADTSSLPPEMLARWTRHIDVLRSETLCLARCVDDIHALTLRHEPALDAIDLCAILRECEHALHHDATMREIVLSLDAPETPVYGMGDPRLVRLALLSFTICLLDLTQPGGRIAWRVAGGDEPGQPTIAITTSHAVLPPDLVASLHGPSRTGESGHSAAIAGRLIIEAQGGDVVLDDDDTGPAAFIIRIPSASMPGPARRLQKDRSLQKLP